MFRKGVPPRMSQIAKTVAPAIASVSSARLTGVRGIASSDMPVDAASANGGVSLQTGAFGFETPDDLDLYERGFLEGRRTAVGGNDEQETRRRASKPGLGKTIVNAPSETFAVLVEADRNQIKTVTQVQAGQDGRTTPSGSLNRIIATYEIIAQVIHGTLPVNGVRLSLTL